MGVERYDNCSDVYLVVKLIFGLWFFYLFFIMYFKIKLIFKILKKFLEFFFFIYFFENENCLINIFWNFLNRKNVYFVLELY